jgi:hypothetical protein
VVCLKINMIRSHCFQLWWQEWHFDLYQNNSACRIFLIRYNIMKWMTNCYLLAWSNRTLGESDRAVGGLQSYSQCSKGRKEINIADSVLAEYECDRLSLGRGESACRTGKPVPRCGNPSAPQVTQNATLPASSSFYCLGATDHMPTGTLGALRELECTANVSRNTCHCRWRPWCRKLAFLQSQDSG